MQTYNVIFFKTGTQLNSNVWVEAVCLHIYNKIAYIVNEHSLFLYKNVFIYFIHLENNMPHMNVKKSTKA